MRLTTTLLMIVVVLASLGTLPATADAVSLEASADAHVMQTGGSDNTNNFGAETALLIKWNGLNASNRKLYVRFDLTGVNKALLNGATFQMTSLWGSESSQAGQTGNLFAQVSALNDLDLGESWDESTITYNNAPANDPGVNDFDPLRTTDLGTIGPYFRSSTTVPGMVFSFSSQALLDAVQDDTNNILTLLMVQTPPNGFSSQWAARDHGTFEGPTLILTMVPEPQAIALVGTGLAGLLACARRKRK